MSAAQQITYRFDLPDGSTKLLTFDFDSRDFHLTNAVRPAPPFWTELRFSQCANCPLDAAVHAHCPAAVHMVGAIEELEDLVSFDIVAVTVTQAERMIYAEVAAQQALSSVLGLLMTTSGCPWTDRLRPMARFHLPFASEAETVYRSVSMYLLAREMSRASDVTGFDALEALYQSLHIVNRDMSRRLGAATRTDAARNAMALLDAFTILLPAAIEASLDELKPLFEAWGSGAI